MQVLHADISTGLTLMLNKTRSVLAVRSLKVSVPYYRDVLGMNIEFEPPGWSFLSRDGFAVMLGECPDSIAASKIDA